VPSIVWIEPGQPLPDPAAAPADGLLAAGYDLSVERLNEAYSKGIFPWFNEGDPVLWWSPDPRMVLRCRDLKVSRSLGKKLKQIQRTEQQPNAPFRITTNVAFNAVIDACSQPRSGQPGTWISPWMKEIYTKWHLAGAAHSIETWHEDTLVGGLYGVGLGGCFFGESMFSRANDASKLALFYLTRFLINHGVEFIDCQQETAHLASLGAKPVPRTRFLQSLATALENPAPPWQSGQLLQHGVFAQEATNPP
jgi:leucyl/phenylalanyl-tRNA--protein transferase